MCNSHQIIETNKSHTQSDTKCITTHTCIWVRLKCGSNIKGSEVSFLFIMILHKFGKSFHLVLFDLSLVEVFELFWWMYLHKWPGKKMMWKVKIALMLRSGTKTNWHHMMCCCFLIFFYQETYRILLIEPLIKKCDENKHTINLTE